MKDIKQLRETYENTNKASLQEGSDSDMAVSQLKSIISNAENITKMLSGEGNLEAWMQSKITKAADYISSAHDHLTNKETETVSEDEEFSMARSELKSIVSNAKEMLNMMKEKTELKGWVQAKLTKAADYLTAVHDNLMSGESETTMNEANDEKEVESSVNAKKIPFIINMKRTSIRQFPNNQSVALYYAPSIDRYISIPFGKKAAKTIVVEEDQLNEISQELATRAYAKRASRIAQLAKDDETDPAKKAIAMDKEKEKLKSLSYKMRTNVASAESGKQLRSWAGTQAVDVAKQAGKMQAAADTKVKTPKQKSPSAWDIAQSQPYGGEYTIPAYAGALAGKAVGVLSRPLRRAAKAGMQKVGQTKAGTAVKNVVRGVKNVFRPLSEKNNIRESFYAKVKEKRHLNEGVGSVVGKAARFIPGVGTVYNLGLAGLRAARGDWTGAGLAAASAIPGPIGWAATGADIARDVLTPNEPNDKSKDNTSDADKPDTPDALPDVKSKTVYKKTLEPKVSSVKSTQQTKSVTPVSFNKITSKKTPLIKKNEKAVMEEKISSILNLFKGKPKTTTPKSTTPKSNKFTRGLKGAGKVGARLGAGMLGGLGSDDDETKDGGGAEYSYTLQPKSSSPERTTGPGQPGDLRLRQQLTSPTDVKKYNKAMYGLQESIIDQLKELATKTDLSKDMLFVNEEKININKDIAEKVLKVYEALNENNKVKFEKMLNEGKQSFEKAVKFALGYK